jgi:hypothetical protein
VLVAVLVAVLWRRLVAGEITWWRSCCGARWLGLGGRLCGAVLERGRVGAA